MSQPVHKKKFGSEFLCKTRYRNTLPLPPFAPKLLALPSSTERCIKFQSTGLNESTANEIILDNQWAIPIDLIEMRENYFGEGRQHHENAASLANGTLNQVDELLLTVPLKAAPGTPAVGSGGIAGSNGLAIPSKHRLPVVSWLRRTEYISSETPTGAGKGAYKESTRKKNVVVDNSREGQISAIEKTFERFSKTSEEKFLAGLKHPTNPGLTAVESLPVFPDFSIWGNDYTLVTFDVDPEMTNDRPSRSQDEGSSQKAQRSSNALIKPMHNANDPETWLAYYLPDPDTAKEINHRKRAHAQLAASGLNPDDDDEDSKEISFTLQRDYTYSTIPCASLSQLVFTFRDQLETKQRAAFYNPMQSKLMLRKKRAKRYEDDDPPITHIDVTSRRMNSDELAAKRDALEAIGL